MLYPRLVHVRVPRSSIHLRFALAALLAIGSAACGGGGGGSTGGGGGATSTTTTTTGSNTGGSNTGGSNTGGSNTGGSNTGGTSPGDALVSGPGHVLAYAAGDEIGIDTRDPVSATFDASSQLIGYVWDLNASTMDNERPLLGTNVVSDAGHTADIGWGRWNGGTMGGNFFGGTFSYSSTQGFHHVIAPNPGVPTATSGGADYALSGFTPPTSADGSVALGSFTGSVHVDFGSSPAIAVKLEPTLGGVQYTIQTSGFPVGSSELPVFGSTFGGMVATTGGGPCGGSCMSFVQGFYAKGGDIVGIAYQVGTTTGRISGVAAFTKP